jgi:branched-chain amino acid aminotransferase
MVTAINDVVNKLKSAGVNDARLRLTVTSGIGPAGVLRGANINWFINAAPIMISAAPAKVKISHIVRNEHSFVSSIKTLSYIENVIALNDAVRDGFDEAIMFNTKGEVAEAATSNLIFDLGGKLVTPALESGVLRGITREILISEFGVLERRIESEEMFNSNGAALISSIRGIQHISHIDSHAIAGSGQIVELAEKYQQLLKSPTEYRMEI